MTMTRTRLWARVACVFFGLYATLMIATAVLRSTRDGGEPGMLLLLTSLAVIFGRLAVQFGRDAARSTTE